MSQDHPAHGCRGATKHAKGVARAMGVANAKRITRVAAMALLSLSLTSCSMIQAVPPQGVPGVQAPTQGANRPSKNWIVATKTQRNGATDYTLIRFNPESPGGNAFLGLADFVSPNQVSPDGNMVAYLSDETDSIVLKTIGDDPLSPTSSQREIDLVAAGLADSEYARVAVDQKNPTILRVKDRTNVVWTFDLNTLKATQTQDYKPTQPNTSPCPQLIFNAEGLPAWFEDGRSCNSTPDQSWENAAPGATQVNLGVPADGEADIQINTASGAWAFSVTGQDHAERLRTYRWEGNAWKPLVNPISHPDSDAVVWAKPPRAS